MTRSSPSHTIQLMNDTTSKWLRLLSSNTITRLLFQRSTRHSLMKHYGAIVLALFLIVGIIVLDDYGLTIDEDDQRWIAIANIDLIMGRETGHFTDHVHHRFYGVAFELPLVLVERILQIEDIRSIHLSRHIITHIFFLVSGFFCYLLTYRMFNSRTLALFAMLLFLLHPRMYAHSFFNSKDIPFMSMFMIALFLTQRAFRKQNVSAFILCGLGLGVLINLRIMGLVLFAAVVAMQVLDLYRARGNRRHILLTTAVFLVSSIWIFYVITPTIWADPVGLIIEWLPSLNQNIANVYQLFRGELFHSRDFHPPEYIPVWASITTPPLVLALGIIGTFTILFRYVTHPSDILHNTTLRFGLILIVCVAAPILAAIYTDANIYNGWRQVYFLYAPFCMTGIFGIHWLMSAIGNHIIRTGVYISISVTIAITVIAMVGMHPHQHVYFNFLVDRVTPELLRTQYVMEYGGGHSFREALEHMLERYPDEPLSVWDRSSGASGLNRQIIPEPERQRIHVIGGQPHDFYITNYREFWGHEDSQESSETGIYTRTIYNNTLVTILPVDLGRVQAIEAPDSQEIDQAYKSVILKPPVWLSDFNLHLDGNMIIYIKSPCDIEDTTERFFLYVFPVDPDDLPQNRQRMGFENLDFNFENRGGMLDDSCVARVHLPEYDITAIETGQLTPDENRIWGARIPISDQVYDSSE